MLIYFCCFKILDIHPIYNFILFKFTFFVYARKSGPPSANKAVSGINSFKFSFLFILFDNYFKI